MKACNTLFPLNNGIDNPDLSWVASTDTVKECVSPLWVLGHGKVPILKPNRTDSAFTKTIPIIGRGTTEHEKIRDSVLHALRSGYRLIDTAQYYHVEPAVGEAVRLSGIPRSEITVITKFWGEWHQDPAQALKISLEALGLDYIDVFLMHWPCAATKDGENLKYLPYTASPTIVETWHLMEKCVGPQCKAIGVSNFTQKTLEELLANASIVPVVNQVELHPLNPNLRLVPYCQGKGIQVISWR